MRFGLTSIEPRSRPCRHTFKRSFQLIVLTFPQRMRGHRLLDIRRNAAPFEVVVVPCVVRAHAAHWAFAIAACIALSILIELWTRFARLRR